MQSWGHRESTDARTPRSDEYSRLLGADWEPAGDGTYRYVGRPWPWQDEPLAADGEDTKRAGRDSELERAS
jgi:hypothetical protein